jgi:hypothetical protein
MMTRKWGISNGEWGCKSPSPRCAYAAFRPHSPFPIPDSHPSDLRSAELAASQPQASARLSSPQASLQPRRPRPAITLIELLVTMVIIAIISAAILGTASAAMESARRTRTQSLITKISGLLLERWDSYGNRRVDINPLITGSGITPIPANSIEGKFLAGQISPVNRGQMLADARLLALRELMKMEMPDRWGDVVHVPLVLANVPALTQTYFRLHNNGNEDENEGAECLYMTVMYATGDGEAPSFFGSQDIADTDDDGAPEFIDGWGNPIAWIRWPSGVISDLQPLNPDGTRPGETDHDPFDIFRRDSPTVTTPPLNSYPTDLQFRATYQSNLRDRMVAAAMPNFSRFTAYRLVPLVYSAGPDEGSAMAFYGVGAIDHPLDPYVVNEFDLQPGELDPDSEFSTKDNITNHLIEY